MGVILTINYDFLAFEACLHLPFQPGTNVPVPHISDQWKIGPMSTTFMVLLTSSAPLDMPSLPISTSPRHASSPPLSLFSFLIPTPHLPRLRAPPLLFIVPVQTW